MNTLPPLSFTPCRRCPWGGVAVLSLALLCRLGYGLPSDFNAFSGVGQAHTQTTNHFSELTVTGGTLISETIEPDGRVWLAFNFTVSNTGGGYHEAVMVKLKATETLPWAVEAVAPGQAAAGDLAPGSLAAPSTATTSTALEVLVAGGDVAAVKAALLAGEQVETEGRELIQFAVPVFAMDAQTAVLYNLENSGFNSGNDTYTLVFDGITPLLSSLTVDSLFLEDISVYNTLGHAGSRDVGRLRALSGILLPDLMSMLREMGKPVHPYDTFTAPWVNHVLQVVSISTVGASTHVVGRRVPTDSVVAASLELRSSRDSFPASPRDPWNPGIGTSFHTPGLAGELQVWEDTRNGPDKTKDTPVPPDDLPAANALRAEIDGLFALHFPFNELELFPGVTLDGEFLLRALGMEIVRVKRGGTVRKVGVRISNHIEANLRLTAEAGTQFNESIPDPVGKTIITAPLPGIFLSIGNVPVSLGPVINVDVGAALSVPTRIQVPFTTSVDAGFFMGWDYDRPEGERAIFDPFSQAAPPKMSDPSIGDDLAFGATVWAQASLDVFVNGIVGPGIVVRTEAALDVAPLATPWWSITGDIEVSGRLALAGLGGPETLLEAPIFRPPSFLNKQATTPPSSAGAGPLHHASGDHVRWVRGVQIDGNGPKTDDPISRQDGSVCRVANTPEDVFVLQDIGAPTGYALSRVDALGNHLWTRGLNIAGAVAGGSPDGGVVLARGSTTGIRLFKYDGNGSLVWQHNHLYVPSSGTSGSLSVVRVLTVPDPADPLDHDVLIIANVAVLPSSDDCALLMRCDSSGALVSLHRIDSADGFFLRDAQVAPDGHLVLCGEVEPRLPFDTTEVGGIDVPITGNQGLLFKVDAVTGGWIWGQIHRTLKGNEYRSLTLAPDGQIFTAGELGMGIGVDYGALQVTASTAGGDFLSGVTIGDGASPGAEGMSTANPSTITDLGRELALRDIGSGDGRTSTDSGVRVEWTSGGVVVAGTTSQTTSRAFYFANLSEELHVRWLTTHETAGEDRIFDFVATDDGIFALGGSDNFLRNAIGVGSNAADCTLLLKLPYEGKVDLHPAMPPHHGFLTPSVHNTTQDWGELGVQTPRYVGSLPFASFAVAESSDGTGSILGAGSFSIPPVTHWVPLESGRTKEPMSYPEWEAYHFLGGNDPEGNADGDDRTNGGEYFFGGSPTTFDAAPSAWIDRDPLTGFLTISTTRSKAAVGIPPGFDFSTDLVGWAPVLPTPLFGVSPLDECLDEISVTLDPGNAEKEFYRFVLPALSPP